MSTRAFLFALLVTVSIPLRAASNADYLEAWKAAEAKTSAREWTEAAKHWAKVVELNPVNARFWEQLGLARYSAKEFREAIPAYEKALELRAGFPFNQAYNIACCYARLDEKEAAFQWLRKSMDLGWRDLMHARNDDDLIPLREDPRFKDMFAVIDTSKMTREEGWRTDLKLLARELKRLHFEIRRGIRAAELETAVSRLSEAIPNLTDAQIKVALMRLMRIPDDGHTSIRPAQHLSIPVQLYRFEEGIFVTAAAPQHLDLVGCRVVKIGEHSLEKALEAVEPLVVRDNAMGPKAMGPFLLRIPELLNGLGLTPDSDKVTLTVRDVAGTERAVDVKATSDQPSDSWHTLTKTLPAAPLYLKNRTAPYWFEFIPEKKTLYWQYNSVRNDAKESVEAFCKRVFKFIEENPVEKLVLDLRWNGGGNTFLNTPIIHGLIKCDKINQTGKLFVIVGRQTFSAAQNATTFIERNTQAIFVGEPTGSSPNFVGETIRFTLPYSKMTGSISDLYWQSSWPMDYRTWIAPQIYAPPTFEAYKSGRDTALEAILAYQTES